MADLLTLSDGKMGRYPNIYELKKFLESYIDLGQGIVILHDSFYDYKFDTKLSSYHTVDSSHVVGHVIKVLLEDEKIYLVIEFNETFNPEKHYICYYRANLESDPRLSDRTLKITNLFAIDLITIADSEMDTIGELSSFEPYSM